MVDAQLAAEGHALLSIVTVLQVSACLTKIIAQTSGLRSVSVRMLTIRQNGSRTHCSNASQSVAMNIEAAISTLLQRVSAKLVHR